MEPEINENVQDVTPNNVAPSVFSEIQRMTETDALNILIQASEAAHKGGLLAIRDSIFLGAAIEKITKKPI